jgi:hypothetical protein
VPTGDKAKAKPPGLVYVTAGRLCAFQSQFGEFAVATYTIILHNSPAFKRVLTMSSPHMLAVAPSRTSLIVLLAAVLGAITSTPVAAQDQRAIINLFGGLIGQAIQQSLRTEWAKLPPDQMSCINLGLSRHGASLQQLISSGVPPDDPRLSGLRATCDKIAVSQLKQQISCPVEGPAGQFVSWCDEDFAQETGDGTVARLGRQDAIRLAFSDRGVTTSLFERADARTRRMQMIANGIDSGRVPVPNFDCAKARTDTEQAICRSYQLSALIRCGVRRSLSTSPRD